MGQVRAETGKLERIKTGSLAMSAQEQIKRYIAESGMKAGDPMPTEKMLEEQLGISRPSIREALRSLEALGIVETRHGVGRFLRHFNLDAIVDSLSYFIPVSVKDFREIIDVRIALESTFIERVAPSMSDEDIRELFGILDELQNEVQNGVQDEDLIQAHTTFHLKLYERTENALLAQLIRVFSTVQRALTVMKKYRTSDTGEFIELHRKVVDALEKRDPAAAREALRNHFKDAIAWSDMHRESQL